MGPKQTYSAVFIGRFPTKEACQAFKDALRHAADGPAAQHQADITTCDAGGFTLQISRYTGSFIEGAKTFYQGWEARLPQPPAKPKKSGWIIQLRAPKDGVRYFMLRGKGVTLDREKAKVFPSKEEAEKKMAICTLWPARKLIPS